MKKIKRSRPSKKRPAIRTSKSRKPRSHKTLTAQRKRKIKPSKRRVARAPRPPQQVFLVIDMLNDFVQPGAPLEVSGARLIIPRLAERIVAARARQIPVVFVCDQHQSDDVEFRVWPPHAVAGTRGSQVIDALTPQLRDQMVTKTTYSGFFKTRLDALLEKIGAEHLIITGVCTNICVLYTAVDALMRGYTIDVPEDCVAALTPDDHRFGMRQLREVLKPVQS